MLEMRTALPSDAQIIVPWFTTRAEALTWGGIGVPEPLTAAWLAQEFATINYWVWVDEAGAIKGVFALNFVEPNTVRLGRFALSPDLRGQRLAKGMVSEIICFARALRAARLSLSVYGSNQIAKHVYGSVGFQVSGERVAYEDPSGVSYQMQLDL